MPHYVRYIAIVIAALVLVGIAGFFIIQRTGNNNGENFWSVDGLWRSVNNQDPSLPSSDQQLSGKKSEEMERAIAPLAPDGGLLGTEQDVTGAPSMQSAPSRDAEGSVGSNSSNNGGILTEKNAHSGGVVPPLQNADDQTNGEANNAPIAPLESDID